MTEMQDFFKKTGKIGGKKRAAGMSREERSASAKKAAESRWAKAIPSASPKTKAKTKAKSSSDKGTL